jgi:hypothetical protein
MNTSAQASLAGVAQRVSGAELPVSRYARAILTRASEWVTTCADYYAAASTYEQLSRLSDAELQRRRLSRDNLARDVCGEGDPYAT